MSAIGTPNAGRMTTSRAADLGVADDRILGVGQDHDAHLLQSRVDVRVVDDLAEQEHAAIGKALPRLVGVLDRAIDAVTEPELARQLEPQVAER